MKTKQGLAVPAGELYTWALFVGRRRWVDRSCDRWYVLSALYGLLAPETVIEPYDVTLTEASRGERVAWARRVLGELDDEFGAFEGVVFEIHAGTAYRDYGLVDELRTRGALVEVPAAGLGQGSQLALYARGPGSHEQMTRPTARGIRWEPFARHDGASTAKRVDLAGPRGTDRPLWEYLRSRFPAEVRLSFIGIEEILGRELPQSARRHRPWWGNHAEGHSHARSWLSAGYEVAGVDLAGGRVTFRAR